MISLHSQSASLDSEQVDTTVFQSDDQDHIWTAGAILRHVREAQGLHLEALAVALKVPVKKLEALELDRYDLLPDIVFARALASSVCRHLKLDPETVLELLPTAHKPSPHPVDATPHISFRSQNARGAWLRGTLSRPALIGGAVLLTGAAAMVFLPSLRELVTFVGIGGLKGDVSLPSGTGATGNAVDNAGAASQTLASEPDTQTAPAVFGAAATLGPSARGDGTSAQKTVPAATLLPSRGLNLTTTSALATGAGVTPSDGRLAAQSSNASSATNRLITFSTGAQPSWVNVTDRNGNVVLSRTIAPGEAVDASGALPLSVVVGRADATRVQVRGESFDLTTYSRDNVARFEVK